MALVPKCVECPDREFDNPGSARGHANRLHHTLIQVDEALVKDENDLVRPVPGDHPTDLTVYPSLTGELGEQLESLAATIRRNMDTGRQAVRTAWEARFAIAEALAKAREILRSDVEFGRWVTEQNFGFSTTRRGELRRLGEHLEEAKAFLDTSVDKEEIGLRTVLREVAPSEPRPPKNDDTALPAIYSAPAAEVLLAFVQSDEVAALLRLDPGSLEILAVDPEARGSLSHDFKLICEQLVEINRAWKGN